MRVRLSHLAATFIAAALLLIAPIAQGATVSLWLMDELVDVSPPSGDPPVNPPGGDTLFDASPNQFDFVSSQNFGTISLTSDRPAVMPPGTSALASNVGGARGLKTPSTTAFHRGNTGEMTIEFWWKSVRITPSVAYVMSFNGGNGGTFTGDWGIYSTSAGDLRFFEYSNGFPEVGSTAAASNGAWHHVAFTIDAAGVMTSYLDGVLQGQSAATGAAAPALADVLKLAISSNDTFGDHDFLMDELRISDVALLPGDGSGDGVLAWNSSLVIPEPASLGMLALLSVGLLRRCGA